MFINDVHAKSHQDKQYCLKDLQKYAKTIQFRRKLDHSCKVLDAFLCNTKNPVISCGGGKDGTAIALLAKLIGAHVPIVCANPPNPLPDRETHIKNLKQWLPEQWTDISYDWDVESVLSGRKEYPEGLKMRVLSEYQEQEAIDGVIFGIRARESRKREINLAAHGEIYKSKSGMRCQPIARWTAEESLCLALLMDAPINPVYIKMDGCGNLEQLHDGTWWAHGLQDKSGWIKRYYPDYYDLYEQSIKVGASKELCRY